MLPDLIPIPVTTAARFSVSGDLTARDQSWALALLIQAIEVGETGTVSLPDNRTREALALTRRDKIVTETARWRRLRDGTMCGLRTPSVEWATAPDGSAYPLRHNLEDRLAVMIDEDLAEAFDPDLTDDVVYLPVRILQHAECRYTVTMMMRLLAWAGGQVDRRWVVRQAGGLLRLRIPVGDLRDALSTPANMKPGAFAEVLETVCREISSLTDYVVAATPKVAHTGRIRDVEIDVLVPDVASMIAEIEDLGRAEHKPRWRPKDRPARRRAPEAARPATPVTVSTAALDVAAPLSVKRPPKLEKPADRSTFTRSEDGILDPFGVGSRDTEIEF